MLKATFEATDIVQALKGTEEEIARFMTGAMRDAESGLKNDLREQVRSAGLGARLANTWRGNVYPKTGFSLTPAGYIWSNAPEIITSFDSSPTIAPHGGKKFLWIPTQNVPRARGARRGSRAKASPTEVEQQFNQDLIIRRGKSGRFLAFVNVIAARNKRGFRPATAGRLAQGRAVKLVLMFVLVPSVKLRKRLDLEGAARFWGGRFPTLLQNRWR